MRPARMPRTCPPPCNPPCPRPRVFRAVVFAYSEVGFRCLQTLLDAGVEVPLVFTHQDSPGERPWFRSVAHLAAERGIEAVTPADPAASDWIARVAALAPEYLLSFYYRLMLERRLLACARWAALNLHGSLLPKYRGRAPVNWAILNGELETGATLHYMTSRADAGDIVDQLAVPILEDDDAREVFNKVTVAAEIVLARSVPRLVDGTARRVHQKL